MSRITNKVLELLEADEGLDLLDLDKLNVAILRGVGK